MLVMRCDEAEANYLRLRNCLNHGEVANADKILCDLQQQNGQSLSEIQNEIQDGANLTQTIGNLT